MNQASHDRPRVLVLLKNLGVGGAETLVLNSARLWDTGRFDYRLAYLGGADTLAPRFAEAGFEPRRLSPTGRENDPLALAALIRYLRAERIDLVHAHLSVPTLLAVAAKTASRTRVVGTLHSGPELLRPLTRRLAVHLAWPRSDLLIAVGEELTPLVPKAKRIEVVENGVDLDRFEVKPARLPGVPDDAPVALVLGSLIPRKRPLETLRVFETALQDEGVRRARLVFAGDGPLREALEAARERSPFRDNIHLLGLRADVPALTRRACVVVLLSHGEGLPMALLEGAAGEAALLGSKQTRAGALIVDGRTGFLVSDDAEAAECLREILRDPSLAEHLGQSAHQRVEERFDLRANVRRIEELYEEVLRA